MLAYLLGAVPNGFLIAKAKGIDIRKVGSGNIGATNAFRILGKTAGAAVLLADGLKGFAACAWLCDVLLPWLNVPRPDIELHRIVAGVAVVLGHNYTCWLYFKGGKGIATSAGVLVALMPTALLIILGVWIVVFALSRYVSLASILASAALPFAGWLVGESRTIITVTAGLAALAIYKHKANIKRLLNGTENRIGRKQTAASDSPKAAA